ncbi:hypothetical protein bcgnr5372_38210 [Bacillus luti]|nr:hypothetical protein [Bacillus cereus]HDR8327206.1 hypothetical protein [Bacillus cereus]HDR8336396.1 hypothetical protein [Bacillus cereus]
MTVTFLNTYKCYTDGYIAFEFTTNDVFIEEAQQSCCDFKLEIHRGGQHAVMSLPHGKRFDTSDEATDKFDVKDLVKQAKSAKDVKNVQEDWESYLASLEAELENLDVYEVVVEHIEEEDEQWENPIAASYMVEANSPEQAKEIGFYVAVKDLDKYRKNIDSCDVSDFDIQDDFDKNNEYTTYKEGLELLRLNTHLIIKY